jgi:hypothetical protein
MGQVRMDRRRTRPAAARARRRRELLLPPDPRDPEVVRAKRLRRRVPA